VNFIEWLLGMILGKDFVFGKNNSDNKDEEGKGDEHGDDVDRRTINNEPERLAEESGV
jgi:hypothetical protein